MIKKIVVLLPVVFFLFIAVTDTHAASVRLAWDPPPGAVTVNGYIVYWSTTSGCFSDDKSVNVLGDTRVTVSGLSETETYYFVVRSFNAAGISPVSNEIVWRYSAVPDAAECLSDINYLFTSSGITIRGSNTGDVSMIRMYVNDVFYTGITPSGDSWQYEYMGALVAGDTLEFRVVNDAGNESETGEVVYGYSSSERFSILTCTLQNGVAGETYSVSLCADSEGITWDLAGGDIPDGLTLVDNTIEGTPEAEGDFMFTISGTDSLNETLIREFIITVDPAGTSDTTIRDPISGTEVIVSTDSGTIVNLQGMDPMDLSPPDDYDFTYGVFSYRIVGLEPGDAATIIFDYEDTLPADVVWYWYNPSTTLWADISDEVGMTVEVMQVRISITDGGTGDSDDIPGQISDPSGPAVLFSEAASGDKGGCFIETSVWGAPSGPPVRSLGSFAGGLFSENLHVKKSVGLNCLPSATVAEIISGYPSIRLSVRLGLLPLIGFNRALLHPGPLNTFMVIFIFTSGIVIITGFRRKSRTA